MTLPPPPWSLTLQKNTLGLKWKSFELQFPSGSVTTAKISDTRPKIVRLKLNVSSVEKATHTKDEKSKQSVLTVKDYMLLTVKGVQLIKNRCSVLTHVVVNQNSYDSILKQNSATQGRHIHCLSQSANKISNHCGHPNPSATGVLLKCPKDAIDKKSILSRRVSECFVFTGTNIVLKLPIR